MIRQSRQLLLDTNVVIHMVRGRSIGQAIDARFQLRTRLERPLIAVVSLGEALSFARQRGWGDARIAACAERSALSERVDIDPGRGGLGTIGES
jgi:predicted nucleic acid-binding protein